MKKSQQGFTILELIVMIGILGVIAVSSMNIFLRSAVSTTKNASIRQVKQAGDYAITQFENDLRGAKAIVENSLGQVCQNDMSEIAFETTDDNTHTWSFDASTDTDNGVFFDNQQLLDSDIRLTSFDLDCSQTVETNTTFVNMVFTLQKGDSSVNTTQEMAQTQFSTKVTLRN